MNWGCIARPIVTAKEWLSRKSDKPPILNGFAQDINTIEEATNWWKKVVENLMIGDVEFNSITDIYEFECRYAENAEEVIHKDFFAC